MTFQFKYNLFLKIIQYNISILNIDEYDNYYIFICYDRKTEKLKNIIIDKKMKKEDEIINFIIISMKG